MSMDNAETMEDVLDMCIENGETYSNYEENLEDSQNNFIKRESEDSDDESLHESICDASLVKCDVNMDSINIKKEPFSKCEIKKQNESELAVCKGCEKQFKKLLCHLSQGNGKSCREFYTSEELRPEYKQMKYYEKNKEKIKKRMNKYYEKNKEEEKEKKKTYYEKNKEKIKERMNKYYEINQDRIKERTNNHYVQNKERIKKYYEKNKDRIKERTNQYYKQNKEKKNDYVEKNKEKIKERINKYYAKNKENIIKKRNTNKNTKKKTEEKHNLYEKDQKRKQKIQNLREQIVINCQKKKLNKSAVINGDDTVDYNCIVNYCMASFWFTTQLEKHMENVHKVISNK